MFDIPEVTSVGGAVIPFRLFVYLGLGALAAGFVFLLRNRVSFSIQTWLDSLLTALSIYLITWKFSYAFLHPLHVIQQPSLLLFGNGGVTGHALGFLFSISWLIYHYWKRNLSLPFFADISLVWLSIFTLLSGLSVRTYGVTTTLPWGITLSSPEIQYHPVHLYNALLGTILLLYIWKTFQMFGDGRAAAQGLMIWGIGKLVISNMMYHSYTLLLGISPSQLFFSFMCILGLTAWVWIEQTSSQIKSKNVYPPNF